MPNEPTQTVVDLRFLLHRVSILETEMSRKDRIIQKLLAIVSKKDQELADLKRIGYRS